MVDTRPRKELRPAPHHHSTREEYAGPLPERVTMPLLDLVTRQSLDEDYADAARRRASLGRPQVGHGSGGEHHGVRLRWVAVATGVFGLLIALAAVQNSRDADVEEAGRQALLERIDQRQREVDGAEQQIASLRGDNEQLRTTSTQVARQLTAATTELQRLQISTGLVPVRGPGVRYTVTDSADGTADGTVRATDLRLLVNGLWEAGADAVAVNGRRLTALSSITNSSIAINVNQQPLTPPYVVSAIGDPLTLEADLLRTGTGVQFQTVADQYGYGFDRQTVDELLLPAASSARLRLLKFAEEYDGAPAREPGAQEEDTTR